MSKLAVKTVSGTSAQGKAGVYYSCHPDDLMLYFDSIVKDFFATENYNNCAIYYETEYESFFDETELSFILNGMQLFVIPVTRKFLTEESRARDFEFQFAMKNGIPILPIIVETSIAIEFESCMNDIKKGYGDIQFLDRTSIDETEIPYVEKLKRFLGAVLVDDKLMECIKREFSANIFLSYRKKNRRFAKEIMSAIHNITAFRDVSIWYDEYLTIGEDWRDELRTAIYKSDLMVLAVTEDIVEPNNYIIEHEYKDAIDAGKLVVPIEKKSCDQDSINLSCFPGISNSIDIEDAVAMLDALERVAVKEEKSNPEHKYLIGLAYLNGIDVEKDYHIALELIGSVAELGFYKAVKKMVDIYNNAIGVERDYALACKWQEKYVDSLNKYKGKKKYKDTEIWIEVIGLSDRLKNIGKYEQAIDWCKKAIVYLNTRNKLYKVNVKRELTVTYNRIGEIYLALGKRSDAEIWFKKALVKRIDIHGRKKSEQSYRDLYINIYYKAHELKEKGALNEARQLLENELNKLENADKLISDLQSQRDLSMCYLELADICNREGEKLIGKAKEYCLNSISIREKVNNDLNISEVKRDLLVAYMAMGDIFAENNENVEAEKYFRKSLGLARMLLKEIETLQSKRDLYLALHRVGDCCRKYDVISARQFYNEARMIVEEICKKQCSDSAKRDLTVCYIGLGKIEYISNNYPDAIEWYKKASDLRKEIIKKSNSLEAVIDIIECYYELARINFSMQNYTTAKEYYDDAIKEYSRVEKSIKLTNKLNYYISKCKSGIELCIEKENRAERKLKRSNIQNIIKVLRNKIKDFK